MLKILLVEDRPEDAELIERQLRVERLAVQTRRVQTRGDFLSAIDTGAWDVVLADFTLPQFGALEVMDILRRRGSDLPVVLVTGSLSEESAMRFIRQGGEDFLLKSSLKRLGTAVVKALERKSSEQEKRRAQAALLESEDRLRLVVDGVQDYAICMLGPDGNVLTWNSGAERIFGYRANEIGGQDFSILYKTGATTRHPAKIHLREALAQGRSETEGWLCRRNGECFYANVVVTPLRDGRRQLRGFSHIVRDETERQRAEETLKSSHAQLRSLAAKLQSLRESEAIRIAREIHDELGQGLTAIKIELSRIADKLGAKGEPLAAKLQATVDLTNATIQSVQRIVTELRPRLLDELGLAEAIRWQVGEFQKRTGIRCRFLNRAAVRSFSAQLSTAVFRILQETLTNVARHACATRVNVTLRTGSGRLRLAVRDNGRGVRVGQVQAAASLGILGMRERTELLGGNFEIRGTSGKGTQVTLNVPLSRTAVNERSV